MTTSTQTPSPDVARLVERLRAEEIDPFAPGLRHVSQVNPDGPEAAALIERLIAERDEARAENARWLLRMEAIREASGVGVLPMLSELPDAIAAKMADHIVDADHVVETVTSHGEADKLAHILHGMVNRRTAIDHEAIERALYLAKYRQDPAEEDREWAVTEGAIIAPLPELSGNPGGLREKVAEAINRAMIDGQGDQDIIHLATDDIRAIPESAALQAGEGR